MCLNSVAQLKIKVEKFVILVGKEGRCKIVSHS